jgi:hypothetical protein
VNLEQMIEAATERAAEIGARRAINEYTATLERHIQPELLRVLTLEETAEFLHVSPNTVREEVRAGKLCAAEIGARGQWRFPMWRLVSYLDPNVKFPHFEQAAD